MSEADPARRILGPDGETWIVEIAGRGVSGTGRWADPGIQLVRFTREAAPSETPLEVVTHLFDLNNAFDHEIVNLLAQAKPPAEPLPPSPERGFDPVAEDGVEVLLDDRRD
jgi:hypothetical protein